MVLRKNEYLIRKRSATQAIHILPKKKQKQKNTLQTLIKKKDNMTSTIRYRKCST